jgi:hypothetical protein
MLAIVAILISVCPANWLRGTVRGMTQGSVTSGLAWRA